MIVGSRFITGSYDRTCRIWDTASGEEMHVLDGHKNVVYAIAFNNPFGKFRFRSRCIKIQITCWSYHLYL